MHYDDTIWSADLSLALGRLGTVDGHRHLHHRGNRTPPQHPRRTGSGTTPRPDPTGRMDQSSARTMDTSATRIPAMGRSPRARHHRQDHALHGRELLRGLALRRSSARCRTPGPANLPGSNEPTSTRPGSRTNTIQFRPARRRPGSHASGLYVARHRSGINTGSHNARCRL